MADSARLRRTRVARHGAISLLLAITACMALSLSLATPRLAHGFEEARIYTTTPTHPPIASLRIAEPRAGPHTSPPQRITVFFQRFEQGLQAPSLELWVDGVEYTESMRFWVDRAWLDLPPGFVWTVGSHTIEASVLDGAGGPIQDILVFELMPNAVYGWPFAYDTPNVVANLLEDYQRFADLAPPPPGPYWHHGLDLRAPEGADVLASIGGYVAYVGCYAACKAAQWNVTILGDDNFLWQYSHVTQASVSGWSIADRVEKGDLLGEVVSWAATTNSALYHHIHLNVVELDPDTPFDPDDWRAEAQDLQTPPPPAVPAPLSPGFKWHNPLQFLGQAGDLDTVQPDFTGEKYLNPPEIFFLQNDSDTAIASEQEILPTLTGNVDIVARLGDERDDVNGLEQNPDGQPYLLGLYDISYSIVPLQTPCQIGWIPRTRLARFDVVPGEYDGALQELLLLDVFQEDIVLGGASYDTKFEYTVRNFYYNVTNAFYGVLDGEKGYWNTDGATVQGPLFPDGTYRVTVYGLDFLGNEVTRSVNVELDNDISRDDFCPDNIVKLQLQSMGLVPPGGSLIAFDPPLIPISLPAIVEGSSHTTLSSAEWPAWYFDDPAAGIRVAVGVLDGNHVEVEYVPYLGDVILEIPAEAQTLPLVIGQPAPLFDPLAASSQPIALRLSTRLARRPDTGQALLGAGHGEGETQFELVTAAEIDVSGQPWLLRSAPGGSSHFVLVTEVPALFAAGLIGLALSLATIALSRRRSTR